MRNNVRLVSKFKNPGSNIVLHFSLPFYFYRHRVAGAGPITVEVARGEIVAVNFRQA
jgi:hypothetical protein